MTKLTLGDITSTYGAASKINENNDLVEQAIDNSLSRYGLAPNQMEADFDMNSNRILNLATPEFSTDPVRLQDVNALIDERFFSVLDDLNITFFDTYADAQAAVNALADDSIVGVFNDENYGGAETRYRVVNGTLVFKKLITNRDIESDYIHISDYGWTGGSDLINQNDIDANPQWIGKWVPGTNTTIPWVVGDMWDTVAAHEATWQAFFPNSTIGTIVPNLTTPQDNKTLVLPNGDIYITDPMIWNMRSATVVGGGMLVSRFVGLQDRTLPIVYMDSAAYTTFQSFSFYQATLCDIGIVEADYTQIFGDYLRTQQNRWIGVGFFGAASHIAACLSYNRYGPAGLGTGGAQGSEVVYIGCNFASTYDGIVINGTNALNHTFIGGDIQFVERYGIVTYGGSFSSLNTAVQNFGYNSSSPVITHHMTGGADFAVLGQSGGTAAYTGLRSIRSESPIVVKSAYPITLDGITTLAADHTGWQVSVPALLGRVVAGGTKGWSFILCDDGSDGFQVVGSGSSTTITNDPSASWTVNEFATGWNLQRRFGNTFPYHVDIISNTATQIVHAALPDNLADRYKVVGLTGVTEPNWDAAPAGGTTGITPGTDQGFSTTQGSPIVKVGSYLINEIDVGDYVKIDNAYIVSQNDLSGNAITKTFALMAEVIARNPGASPPTITLNKTADVTTVDASGFWGAPIVDNNVKWMPLDFDAITTGGGVLINPSIAKGRIAGPTSVLSGVAGVDFAGGRATDLIRTSIYRSQDITFINKPTLSKSVTAPAGTLVDLWPLLKDFTYGQTVTVNVTANTTLYCSGSLPEGQLVSLRIVSTGAFNVLASSGVRMTTTAVTTGLTFALGISSGTTLDISTYGSAIV